MTRRSKASALNLALCASAILALSSCMADTQQLAFAHLEGEGWVRTDTLSYTLEPMSGVTESGISILLHTEKYEYGNIAFDITIMQDSALLYHKQHDYLLEECRPQKGIGHRNDYTLPVGNVTLCDTLPTIVTLTQQLDHPHLNGIRKVGIRVSAPMSKPGEPVWKANW